MVSGVGRRIVTGIADKNVRPAVSIKIGDKGAGNLEKLPRQIDASPQQAQIMAPRNLDPSKLLQMRREPLRVEQDEFAGAQMIHQRYERNLGRIGHAMKN